MNDTQSQKLKTATEKITDLLSSLNGVVDVARIRSEDIGPINQKESEYERLQVVELKNIGIYSVLERDLLFAILKDNSFRPPPIPTIFLAEERDHEAVDSEQCLVVNDNNYHIVGEEIIGSKVYSEKTVKFGDGFVLFPERRAGQEKVPAYFIIPPVDFPELSAKQEAWGIKNCMSISPSTLSDDYIREAYDLSKDPSYATILVGCDVK
jgi:hypothetical protein